MSVSARESPLKAQVELMDQDQDQDQDQVLLPLVHQK